MTENQAPDPAPGQFRKKPVVIEAMQWDGSWDSAEAIKAAFPTMDVCSATLHPPSKTVRAWSIRTLEGSHAVSVGDWIIKGVKGEFYPCKPDVFAMTYEPAQAAIPAPEGAPELTDAQLDAAMPTPEQFGPLMAPWDDRDRKILRTAMRAGAALAAPAPHGAVFGLPVPFGPEVESLEREHLGDPDKGTGIYHQDNRPAPAEGDGTDWKAIARVQSAKLAVALDEPGARERLEAVMRSADWKADPQPKGLTSVCHIECDGCLDAGKCAFPGKPAEPVRYPHPDEDDAVTLWAEIHRLRAAVQGPDGYATWQEAATAERVRRVAAEKALAAAQAPAPAHAWDRDAAVKQIADERVALLQAKYASGWTAEQEARFEALNADMDALCPRVTKAMQAAQADVRARLNRFIAEPGKACIYDHLDQADVLIRIDGDFESDADREQYVNALAARLQAPAVGAEPFERRHHYGRCTITGPAEDVAFIFSRLPDVDEAAAPGEKQ